MTGTAIPLLELRGITKSYGPARVLDGIDLRLERGQSIALIGENGAGKSTFSKILTGVIRPDAGEILIEGVPQQFGLPRDALAKGIAFIPQELASVPRMSVAENLLLGQWPAKAGFTAPAASLRRAEAECARFGIDLGDLRRPMAALKLADRQLAEIVKALIRRARIIVLDEPTASLSEQESRALFAILRKLNAEGVGILYISHRMDEVYDFSDLVVVFRNGRHVAAVPPATTTHAQLIAHMLGAEKESFVQPPTIGDAEEHVAAELRGWSRPGLPALFDISVRVGAHEVVGLYGVRGSGADLVAEALGGLRPDVTGRFRLYGRVLGIPADPLAATRQGIAYVPAERKRDGLVLHLPIRVNLVGMIARRLSRFGFLRRKAETKAAATMAREFDVRCRSLDSPWGSSAAATSRRSSWLPAWPCGRSCSCCRSRHAGSTWAHDCRSTAS